MGPVEARLTQQILNLSMSLFEEEERRTCSACLAELPRAQFSGSQWKKEAGRRCAPCGRAPIMMQQTNGVGKCRWNAWPVQGVDEIEPLEVARYQQK